MEVSAKLSGATISAQKARLVADQIRGKSAEEALDILTFSNKKAAGLVLKLLNSAIANAEHNEGADVDELKVSSILLMKVNVKTSQAACQKGRADRISALLSHNSWSC